MENLDYSSISAYGSFHQHYRLDGKLIAVGVIDLLPRCLSSVYLFYDPDYSFLSLGVLSALYEISYTTEILCKACPRIAYYYMGYFIDTCEKMRYKASYRPSQLLDPFDYSWVWYDQSVTAIHRRGLTPLNLSREVVEDDHLWKEKVKEAQEATNIVNPSEIQSVILLIRGSLYITKVGFRIRIVRRINDCGGSHFFLILPFYVVLFLLLHDSH